MHTIDEWSDYLDSKSGTHIHAIFLDWKKAFDRVPHKRLLSKLKHFGVNGCVLAWLTDFLSNRTQQVIYKGSQSLPCDVVSGVIQGSVLGPLLFNLYMIDLPKCVTSPIVQYADDSTLYRVIRSQDDIVILQSDLSNIETWCYNNGMELNTDKCKVMDITNCDSLNVPYIINKQPLEYCYSEKLLGVIIASNLKWNIQTDAVRQKAAKLLGFVARNLRGCTSRVKRLAYVTLIKPVMLYGTPSWHPTTSENCSKLESIHRRGLRFIYGKNPTDLEKKSLPTIQQQLLYNDLTFFNSCTTGKTDLNITRKVMQGREIRGQPGVHRLIPPKARTSARLNGYVYRTVCNYNALPLDLKTCPSKAFKDSCMKHVMGHAN